MRNVCKVEGCVNYCHGKGYCKKHYGQLLRRGKILKRTPRTQNKIIIKGDIAEIILYNNKSQEVARTIIDSEDLEKIRKYKWHLNGKGYVETTLKKRSRLIQHVIMGFISNMETHIDHKDQNKQNNRKNNYRVCTNRENLSNRGKQKNNTSGYKGVWKNGIKWVAGISVNQKSVYLGIFKNRKDAAIAYNKGALKYHGEFACLNKV